MSSIALSEVNCSQDFIDAGNLVYKADRLANESNQHDKKHEQLIYQSSLKAAKQELELASEIAFEAINSYTEAKKLYDGILDYRCRYKVKKSMKRVTYIEYRLEHLEYKITIMNLMQRFL